MRITINEDDTLARTVSKQAKRIGRTPQYLHKLIQSGHLKAYRPAGGGDLMVLDSDFKEWLTADDSSMERVSGRGWKRGRVVAG